MLVLDKLPHTQSDGVKLVKAKRDKETVSFQLQWTLDPSAKPKVDQLEDLGATGMAARLRMLEQQGVQF